MPFKIDELFYELDARTAGFENKITHAQTSVDNFAKFIREKPMLATAALAASIVAVGIAAVKMASDVDDSIRKVQAAFPGATGEINKLRNAIALLSTESPRSQRELAAAAAAISEKGVTSVDELITRLRTVTLIADATGESMETIADGLDNVSDAFRLTTRQAADAVTTIYGFTQGKVGIGEVFSTLQRGGAILADLGVRAEDAGEAMAALIDAGVNRRQVGVVLTNVLELTNRVRELRRGTEDQARAADIIDSALSKQNITNKGFIASLGELATGLEKAGIDTRELGIRSNTLTAITRVAEAAAKDHRTQAEKLADAQERLAKAAETNRTSAHALSQILINELGESFIRLGNKILPTVISLLEKTADLMARIRGEGNPLKDLQTLQGTAPIGELPQDRGFSGQAFRRGTRFETDAEKQARAFVQAYEGAATRAQRYGPEAFSGLTSQQIQKIIDNVRAFTLAHPETTIAGQAGIEANNKAGALIIGLQEALKAAITGEAEGGTGGGGGGAPANITAPLEKATRDAIRAMRQSVRDTLANATVTQIDDATSLVDKFRAEVDALEKQARQKLPDLRAEVDRLSGEPARVEAKERAEAARQVADEVAKALGVQSVAMQQSLDDFNTEVAKRNAEYAKLGKAPLFTDEQVAQVRAVREALISATQAAEETDAVLSRIRAQETARAPLTPSSTQSQRLGEQGFNVASSIELQATLAKRRQELAEVANKQDAASKAKAKALLDQIAALQGKINDLEGRNRQITNDINNALLKRIALLQQQAAAISQAAGLVAQLAGAFGETGREIADIVNQIGNIGQAAASVKPFIESLKLFQSGAKDDAGNPLMSLSGVLGAAMPIIGGLTSAIGLAGKLFGFGGPSPEELERRRLQRENTAALRDLSENVGDLARINVTGTEYGKYSQFLSNPRLDKIGPQFGQFTPDQINRAIGSLLDAANITSQQLIDFAHSFGVTVGTGPGGKITLQDLDNLRKAMQSSELTQFADTFTGQMQEMDAAIHLFDVTDPVRQLELFRKALDSIKNGGGILQKTIDEFDTSTAEGLAAAQEAIQKLFEQLQAGEITPEMLGGLTAQEFLDALLKEADLLRAAQASTGELGTGGFNVDRTITEATGSRVAALILTGNYFAERTALATEAIAAVLGAGVPLPSGLRPPELTGTSAGGGDVIYNITVEFNGPVSGDPDAVGGRIGSGILKEINKGLGREAKVRTFTAGRPLKVGG